MCNNLIDAIRRAASSAVALAFVAIAASAGAQGLAEGVNYVRLKSPMPVETGKNIEVIEFFSYGCPHCGELEPLLQTWIKNKPADVTFRRIPVMFQPRWENLAKAYYTLEALGEDSKLSPEVFAALHARNAPLWNEKDFLDWVGHQGRRPQEGRGALQLVRDRGQGQSREAARAAYQHPVGADDHRRRQVRDRSREAAGRTRRRFRPRSTRWCKDRAPNAPSRSPPSSRSTRAMRVFLTGASSGLGEALARHYAARGRDARPVRAARARACTAWPRASRRCDGGDVPRRRARAGGSRAAPASDFMARFGVPDVVIANAGVSRGMLTETPEDLPAFRRSSRRTCSASCTRSRRSWSRCAKRAAACSPALQASRAFAACPDRGRTAGRNRRRSLISSRCAWSCAARAWPW